MYEQDIDKMNTEALRKKVKEIDGRLREAEDTLSYMKRMYDDMFVDLSNKLMGVSSVKDS